MKDTDLYSRILGLSDPWFVADVELDTAGGRVDVEHTPGIRWRCPTCGRELACRDPTEPRVWCHLDTCQFKTFLHARVHQRRGRGTQQQDHGHQAQACGYRNREHFKTAIYFFCGGLDLYPKHA